MGSVMVSAPHAPTPDVRLEKSRRLKGVPCPLPCVYPYHPRIVTRVFTCFAPLSYKAFCLTLSCNSHIIAPVRTVVKLVYRPNPSCESSLQAFCQCKLLI